MAAEVQIKSSYSFRIKYFGSSNSGIASISEKEVETFFLLLHLLRLLQKDIHLENIPIIKKKLRIFSFFFFFTY